MGTAAGRGLCRRPTRCTIDLGDKSRCAAEFRRRRAEKSEKFRTGGVPIPTDVVFEAVELRQRHDDRDPAESGQPARLLPAGGDQGPIVVRPIPDR